MRDAPLHRLLAPLDAVDIEELVWFHQDVESLRQSRFASRLEELGDSPTLRVLRRYPTGGGEGVIRVRASHPEVRGAVFAVLRKLRTDHEPASITRTAKILSRAAHRRATTESDTLTAELRTYKRRLRDADQSRAAVGFVVTDEEGRRPYETTGSIVDLVQNGRVFHSAREKRRDLDAIVPSLADPSVDRGLRFVAEIAFDLDDFVALVVAAPELVAR